ncbi:MAG: hypothetical protein AB1714_02140 [Acidobacteriota bacterium]
MNPKIRLAAVASAVVLGAVVGYLYFFSTEAVVKRTIRSAANAFENRALDDFMDAVSKDYTDEYQLSYGDISEGASEACATFEGFKVTLEKMEVVVEGSEARASMLVTVVATTKDREKWMVLGRPDSGQPADLRLRLEGKRWRVVRATGVPQPR